MANLFPLFLRDQYKPKQSAPVSSSSKPEVPAGDENPAPKTPDSHAMDIFKCVSGGSHGGTDKVIEKKQASAERARRMDEFLIREMGNPHSSLN